MRAALLGTMILVACTAPLPPAVPWPTAADGMTGAQFGAADTALDQTLDAAPRSDSETVDGAPLDDGSVSADAAPPDAGATDIAMADAAVPDAAVPDAAVPDAPPDLPVPDAPTDLPVPDAPPADTPPPDSTGSDAIADAGPPDANKPDACPPTPQCQPLPLLTVDPAQPQAGQSVTATAYDLPGWTYVGLTCTGPCGPIAGAWQGVQPLAGGGFAWNWSLTFPNGGGWQCAFTADNGSKTVATLAVTVQGPGCAPLPPGGLVSAKQGQFWLDGKPLRFVGVNVRGLAHYGGKDVLPYADAGHVALTLQAAKAIGARVVRVFAANDKQPHAVNAQRLKQTLDAAHAHGLKLIVALTDYYPTGFFPKDDAKFYYKDPWGYDVLVPTFFALPQGGWQENYEPWLKAVVPVAKGHPALFAWELGNEIKSPTAPAQFVAWAKQMAAAVKALDATHMVTVGLISTKSAALSDVQAKDLYGSPHLDFATIHAYDGSDEEDDSAVPKSLGKPFVVEEAGFSGDNRGPKVDADVGKWVGKGAVGYLQWGFMATPYDNGDGDGSFGMDQVLGTHKQDWDALSTVYLAWSKQL